MRSTLCTEGTPTFTRSFFYQLFLEQLLQCNWAPHTTQPTFTIFTFGWPGRPKGTRLRSHPNHAYIIRLKQMWPTFNTKDNMIKKVVPYMSMTNIVILQSYATQDEHTSTQLMSQQNAFGPPFLHSLLRLVEKAQRSLTPALEVCNKYDLL